MRKEIFYASKKVLFDGVSKEEQLNEILSNSKPSSAKTITSLFYGTLRMYFPFQEHLKEINENRSLKKDVKLLSTMAYVQFFQMDSMPDYAVLDEMIKVLPPKLKNIKKHFTWLLHKILKVGKSIKMEGFLPEYMRDELKKSLGIDFSREYEEFILKPSKKYFCTESLGTLEDKKLLHKDYPFYSCSGLNADEQKKIIEQDGVICELNSMLIPYYFKDKKGKDYLDLCSAPGSKLLCAKIRYKDDQIIGIEKDKARYLSLEKRVENRVELKNIDALAYLEDCKLFDKIVLDAPCSGLGTLVSNPEWLEFKNESIHHKKLPGLQKKLLKKALLKLNPKGQLIYSVCTYSLAETQMVIKEVIGDKYKVKKISNLVGEKQIRTDYGTYLLPSKKVGNQIFFVALIEAIH
ncbi:MAG: hypothetical protein COB02_03375 [Candidatus Cloacimonadota bacterium]|nr:MAG: hypothetical protein COB02_03375 [Candidatus Cloacimonadota bacterium]